MLLPLQIFFANGGASPLDRVRYLFLFWLSGSGYTIAMKVYNNNCRFLLLLELIFDRPDTPSSARLAGAGELPASSPTNGKIKHCRRGTLHIHTIICLADLCRCWRVA